MAKYSYSLTIFGHHWVPFFNHYFFSNTTFVVTQTMFGRWTITSDWLKIDWKFWPIIECLFFIFAITQPTIGRCAIANDWPNIGLKWWAIIMCYFYYYVLLFATFIITFLAKYSLTILGHRCVLIFNHYYYVFIIVITQPIFGWCMNTNHESSKNEQFWTITGNCIQPSSGSWRIILRYATITQWYP